MRRQRHYYCNRTLEAKNVFEEFKPDVVIYDILGDVICGGFFNSYP
jgi:nitrogenase subunit NifH